MVDNTLCVVNYPLTTFAAETSTSYTFEQLLEMNKEEISSISDECAIAYEAAESTYRNMIAQSNINGAPIHIVFINDSSYLSTDEYGNVLSVDSEKILEELKIPAEIINVVDMPNDTIISDCTYHEYTLVLKISSEEYHGHDMSDVFIKTYIALLLNPEILHTRLEMIGTIHDEIETTTTTTQSELTSTSATAENTAILSINMKQLQLLRQLSLKRITSLHLLKQAIME